MNNSTKSKHSNSKEGKSKTMPINAKKQGIKFLALNTLVPFFLIILLILIVQTTLKFQIHKYAVDSADSAAIKLANIKILPSQDCDNYYETSFLLTYLDGNKNIIMTNDYGSSLLQEDFAEFKKNNIGNKSPETVHFKGKIWAVSVMEMTVDNDIGAVYVNILFDMTTLNKIVFDKILAIVSVMFAVIFLVQIVVAIVGTKIQINPYVEQLDRNQELVADISHEFNTPLAIINAKLSNIIANSQEKDDALTEDLLVVLEETKRLKRMVKDMLFLSKNDRAKVVLNKKKCDISEKINSIIEPFSMQCEADGKSFFTEIQPNIVLETDGDKIRQVAIIFMDNAVKYTSANDNIILRLEEKNGKIILSVTDTGIGVDDAKMNKLFERFYRVDTARTDSKIGGVGLGLSIAKAIAQGLGGKLSASKNIPKGFRIQLELKRTM